MNSFSVSTEIVPTDKEEVAFKDLDAAILVGSMPRKEGMERKDLLKANVAIFKSQGAALEKYAKKTVKVMRQDIETCTNMQIYRDIHSPPFLLVSKAETILLLAKLLVLHCFHRCRKSFVTTVLVLG